MPKPAACHDLTNPRTPWWTLVAHCFAPLVIVLSWTVAYLSQELKSLPDLFDSDGLTLELLWVDVFQNGGNWSDWYMPHAPRFLPDMAVYFGLRSFLPDAYWAIYAFGLVMLLLVYFTAIWAASLSSQSRGAILLAQVSILVIFCFLALNGDRPYSFTYCATFHTGMLIHGSLLIVFHAYLIRNPEKSWSWIGIAFLALVGTGSDLLFLIAYLAPFCLALLIRRILDRRPTVEIRLVPLIACASILGMFIKNQLIRDTTPAYFDFSQSKEKAWTIPATFLNVIEQNPLTTLLWCSFYIIIMAQLVYWIRNRNPSKRHFSETEFPLWQLTFLVSAVAITAALLARGYCDPIYVEDLKDTRLFISIPFAAFLFPWLPFKDQLKKSSVESSLLIAMLVVVFAAFIKYYPFSREYHSEYRPDWIEQFDQHLREFEAESGRPMRRGMATYWPTKATLSLSQHDLSIGQYTDNLDRYYCLNSTEWYFPEYDFVIADFKEYDQNFLDALIHVAGEPERVYRCDDLRLVIFAPGTLNDSGFAISGRSIARLKKMWVAPTVRRKFGGLQSPADHQLNHTIIYGPFVRLREGKYIASFVFDVKDNAATGNFACEVYLSNSKTLEEQKIFLPVPEQSEVRLAFEISQEQETEEAEFRVWKDGPFDLTLKEIIVKAESDWENYQAENKNSVYLIPTTASFKGGLQSLRTASNATRLPDTRGIESPSTQTENHIVVFGPYVKLDAGHYVADFSLELGDGTGPGRTICEITSTGGEKLYARKEVKFLDWRAGETRDIKLTFDVQAEAEEEEFEFRVWKEGAYSLILRELEVTPHG